MLAGTRNADFTVQEPINHPGSSSWGWDAGEGEKGWSEPKAEPRADEDEDDDEDAQGKYKQRSVCVAKGQDLIGFGLTLGCFHLKQEQPLEK